MAKSVFELRKASKKDLKVIKQLLDDDGLPTQDIANSAVQFYLFKHNGQLTGISGIEHFGNVGLLRSVVIKKGFRNNNWGKGLVLNTIDEAKKMKINQLYLLTTTAERFFRKLGFAVADRNRAPKPIQNTKEFSNLCPESANFMVLNIK